MYHSYPICGESVQMVVLRVRLSMVSCCNDVYVEFISASKCPFHFLFSSQQISSCYSILGTNTALTTQVSGVETNTHSFLWRTKGCLVKLILDYKFVEMIRALTADIVMKLT